MTIGVTVVWELEIMIWPTAIADKRTTEAITSDLGFIDLRSVGIRVTLFSTKNYSCCLKFSSLEVLNAIAH